MGKTNMIGLDEKDARQLSESLNDLLANYQVFYQSLRGFHWNIKGEKFFELHLKFEELYTDALLKIDEIAERILTLDSEPLHTFTDYVKNAEIKEAKSVHDAKKSVEATLEDFAVLLKKERGILKLASKAADEGTVALMSDYITQHEKTIWMLKSYMTR